MIATVFLGGLTLLFLLGMPAAFALGVTSLLVTVIQRGITDIPYQIIAQRLMYGVNSFPLLAIPFFLLAGNIMNTGGITDRIFRFARALVGFLPGGLGHVNVMASMIFAGMSGSAVADAMGLGTVEIKAMRDAKYPDDFSAAITAASSSIGPIIPPSIPLVVYGVLGNVSVSALLIAGLVPGVLMGVALMIWIVINSRRLNLPREGMPNLREIAQSFREALLPLLAPAIIVFGIWTGIFTPTEAAAVSAVYALVLTMGIYREVRLQDLYGILRQTLRDTVVVLFIIATAALYAWLLILTRVPIVVAQELTSISSNPYVILMLVNVFLLIVGCFMESIAAITILTPILLPLVQMLGVNPIHFGMIMVLNLMIGLLTPPLGMSLYAVMKVANISFERLVRAVIPFYIPLIVVLLLITFIPGLVLFLPKLMLGIS